MTSPKLSKLGFGAYQIGRVSTKKYASVGTPLPNEEEAEQLLNGVLDCGITLIDTAPAYGVSEKRIGKYISHRRNEYILSSKVGEQIDGSFDFTSRGMLRSVEKSLKTLNTDHLDYLLIHAPTDDLSVLADSDAVSFMHNAKQKGLTKRIGFSGKTIKAQMKTLEWADVLMIDYSLANQSQEEVILAAHEAGAIVLVKKGLNSGHLSPQEAIDFLLCESTVSDKLSSIVIGSKSLLRMKENQKRFRSLES